MTRINRITIHGFKSFAHKTEIPFADKYNCILGPNGSGKSNIGDAICFVLGRLSSKSMRAEKSANLIFNGGKKGKPGSKAYVEIAFDNTSSIFPTEEKEVIVRREISNKGSTYKINGKKRTRTEVLDTLGLAKINPDGYNIILQGSITKFVDISPVERRKILEQISDVSTYEDKKHKAMLELNKVEEKLGNAQIILKERKTYLKELKKDRDQALQFKQLQDSIDAHRATLVYTKLEEQQQAHQKFTDEMEKHQTKLKGADEKIAELKKEMAAAKQQSDELNKKIEQHGEKEQVKVHRELEELKVALAQNKTRISTIKDELNKIQLRKDQFREESKELQEKAKTMQAQRKTQRQELAKRQQELKEFEAKIAEFKKKHNVETSQALELDLEEKDKLIDTKQEEVQTIRQQQQELLREKDKLEYQIQTIDERIAKVKAVEQENKGQLQQLQQHKQNFKQLTLRLNKCLEQDSSFAAQVSTARGKLEDAQEQRAQLQAKTASMQASLAGNAAVSSILDNKKQFSGVFGTIAQLGEVKKKYAQAVETAAGGKLQQIVVDTDKTAAECIQYLKERKVGSASFIPLNKIQYREISASDKPLQKKSGVHDFALNLVNYPSKYKKAFAYVFGNTLVVDDMQAARQVGIGRVRMATLDGNLAESSGVMRGGFQRQRSGGFKEQGSLEALEKAEGAVAELEGVLSNIREKRAANETEITTLRQQRAELEGELIKLEKSLHLNTGDLEASSTLKKEVQAQLTDVDNQLREVQKQISLVNRDLATLKSKKHELRSQVSQLRNPRLQAQLQAYEESRQQCRETIVRLESELKNSEAHVEQLLSPEQQKMQEILKQHEKEEKSFSDEIKALTKAIALQEKELTGKEEASKAFYAKYKGLFQEREQLGKTISQAENSMESFREKQRQAEREINLLSLKNAEVKARLAGLEEEYKRYEGVELLKNKSLAELQKEVSKFEVMLGQMSAVNMKALEVYEQVEAEYTKLVDKREGLEKEKVDVLTMMNEIETKKTEHFMKTFKQANDNFQRIFSSLFKKGKAHLELDNPKQPFEDGVSIKVKLTGKRYLDIKSLSGGEKTLTALSFIFAIQEYQPASFYILDEIDAALDKHNSGRLAQLIRSYSDRAQYILISHNDSLISEADNLYGVSMTDGISKITSLQI